MNPARRRSLSGRLVAASLVWLLLSLVLGGGVLAWGFRESVERQFELRLDSLVRAAIAALDRHPDGSIVLARPLGDPRFDQIYSGWYWQVAGADGRLTRSRSLWDQTLPVENGHAAVSYRSINGPNGEKLMLAERDVSLDGGGTIHVLVGADRAEVADGVRRFDWLLTLALGGLGLGLAMAVIIQVRFGLRPLHRMAHDLEAVRCGQWARLPNDYPREVAPLADAMNMVLDNDAELIERARTHVGNLAHGLKTPLAVLQAELAGDPDRQVMQRQLGDMRRLVERHLGRAAASAGAGRALGGRVAVAPVAADIAAALGKIFAERGLTFDLQAGEDADFLGDADDLAEILGNLLENACKWAKSQVRLTAGRQGDGLSLCVEDDGPGMSPEQAAQAADRGARMDQRAEGWGLGLSIVADLVSLHGGTMEFRQSPLGGLAVDLRL
ncbi:MAG: HAMP domain-containing histidine kinase [Magnetospirillum gryphiswaldense]|nr:HAMP domain-containing histidine kinase [Magnetospirillum gryphiswaldense]